MDGSAEGWVMHAGDTLAVMGHGSGGLRKIVYVETLRNSRGIEPRVGGRERLEVFLNRMGINHFIRRSRLTAFKRRGPQRTATNRI